MNTTAMNFDNTMFKQNHSVDPRWPIINFNRDYKPTERVLDEGTCV